MDKDKTVMLSIISNATSKFKIPVVCVGEKAKGYLVCEQYWLETWQMLTNYFTGQELFKGLKFCGDLKKINEEKEELREDIESHIAAYEMLSYGWDEITRELNGFQLPGETPGKAFAFILEERMKGMKKHLDRNLVANPRGLYLACLQYKKCRELEESEEGIPEQEHKKLETLVKRLKKKDNLPISEGTLFVLICRDICLRSKDKTVRRKAKDYQSYSEQAQQSAARRGRYA